MLVIVALLIQQGYFTDSVNGDEPKTLLINASRSADITHNRQGIKKAVGQAWGDYNNDGWVDFVIGNHGEGYRLYRNQRVAGNENHWLSLQLVGGGPAMADESILDAALACQQVYTDAILLSEQELDYLLAFLNSLTSHAALDAAQLIPVCVPSGLAVGGY
jgi:hypothetical protein